MLWKQINILILILSFILSSGGSGLELVDDNEFISLCQTEKYVIALFSKYMLMCLMGLKPMWHLPSITRFCLFSAKDNCEECDNIENELISIREDLVDDLSAWVVKIRSSNLVQIYSPSRVCFPL